MQGDLYIQLRISAILSDYDGTLCSTRIMKDFSSNKVPVELDATLSEISKDIPICIVSSKDFRFLCDKITFATIVSCIMGIETIVLKRQVGNEDARIKNGSNHSVKAHLIADNKSLSDNSKLLTSLGNEIPLRFFVNYCFKTS